MDKEVEKLEDRGGPKVQDLVETDKEMWICSSYPFRHKSTLHCAERNAKVFGEFTMQLLKLHNLYCEMYIHYLRK